MKRWDDLKILAAVVREGSISAGATYLGLDQSTVSRRLQAIEAEIGHRVFEGATKRHKLSLIGQLLYEGALRLEREMEIMNLSVAAVSNNPSGVIHVDACDIISTHLLLTAVPGFLEKHPGINLRIRTPPNQKDDMRGEVLLIASNSPKENMFGRKLATATFAAYASAKYLEKHKGNKDDILWLNWDDGSDLPNWPNLAPKIPENMCRIRINSVPYLLEAVRLGLGATILPCFIGDRDPQLSRIAPGIIVSRRDIWLLVHSDLRRVTRIRNFLEFMTSHVRLHKSLIESQ